MKNQKKNRYPVRMRVVRIQFCLYRFELMVIAAGIVRENKKMYLQKNKKIKMKENMDIQKKKKKTAKKLYNISSYTSN